MTDSLRPLARILAAVVQAQEQEGARVARLLHDEVGQILSAVGLRMDLLRMDVEAGSPEVAKRIAESQGILEKAIDQVRSLSQELQPAIVERAGLQIALDRLVSRYREMSSRPIRLLYDSSIQLPAKTAASMYKIAVCALDNAVKHGRGGPIELMVDSEGGGVLEIRDGGGGFDVEAARNDPPGLGLPLMGCYADQGGLVLEVNSSPGRSTIVRARVPDTRPSSEEGE